MVKSAGESRRMVTCRCGPIAAQGTYETVGRFLILNSRFGTMKTVLGLQDPQRLAGRMLRNACCKEAADLDAPAPEVIDATRAPGPSDAMVSTVRPTQD